MPQQQTPVQDIAAVILAGGKARRMGGQDKGLIKLNGRPLLSYVIAAIQPQVGRILINANRNQSSYQSFGYPVIQDTLDDFLGPLAGIATGMQAANKPYLLCVPCDSPFPHPQLVDKLFQTMQQQTANISVAHDGQRMQPVFALLNCTLLPDLLTYLQEGGRKTQQWYRQQRLALTDFSSSSDMFLNLNKPDDETKLIERLVNTTQS